MATQSTPAASHSVSQRMPSPYSFVDQEAQIDGGDHRREMIAQAAYFRAQHRDFAPGGDLEDWLAAEAEVDGTLAPGSIPLDGKGR